MSHRLWGACASQQGLLGAALGPDRLSLRLTGLDENPVSWGIGFYERSEPLVRKCPLEKREEIDLSGVVAETRSDLLIGHVRAPTIGALVADNTHPFRFHHWLFAHDGTIAKFEAIQEQMVNSMPSFLGRSMVGVTDSECFFHLVLAFLHDSQQLGNPQLGPEPVREALIKAVAMVDELASQKGSETVSTLNILMTNGAYIMALHRSPLELRYMTYTAPSREKIRPRAVLVACEKSTAGSHWTAMPPNSVLTVAHDLTVDIHEF